MAQFSFVIFSERDDSVAATRERLEATGHVQVAATVSELDELREAVALLRPEGVFADLGAEPDGVLDLLAELPAPRPFLLLVGPQEDSGPILRAMQIGAKQYFPCEPSEEALHATIERLVLESQPAAAPEQRAAAIAVMGVKGGVGATVVACQLATSLQRCGSRTVIVDLNLPLGDVALHFDVHPAYTLGDLAREVERLDATYLRTVLHAHRSGVQILAAPSRVEEAELVQGHHVERVLELLRRGFDWVVLDVSRSWNPASMRAVDLADQILLVTLLDVPTLNHANQHLDLLRRLGHSEKVRLVANRYSSRDAITGRDLARFLGEKLDFHIPNDYRTTLASVNHGRPIAEVAARSALAKAYAKLAEQAYPWCHVERPAPPTLGQRIRRLFGKKKRHGSD